jgi:hypothetical protein
MYPFNIGSTPSYILPALTKPLLRVSTKTVSIDKIRKFIYKRMGSLPSLSANDIEILRDGVLLDVSTPISQYTPGKTKNSVSMSIRMMIMHYISRSFSFF